MNKQVNIYITSNIETWGVSVETDTDYHNEKSYICDHIYEIVYDMIAKYKGNKYLVYLNGNKMTVNEVEQSWHDYWNEEE